MPRLTLLGVGAMNSPRYRPAGLLVTWARHRVMLDGGDGADPDAPVDDRLVTDERAELISRICRRAHALALRPRIDSFAANGVRIHPLPVQHTSHPTVGYIIETAARRAVWAPEFGVSAVGDRRRPDVRRRGRLETADPVRPRRGRACLRCRCRRCRPAGRRPPTGVRPQRQAEHRSHRCESAPAIREMGHRGFSISAQVTTGGGPADAVRPAGPTQAGQRLVEQRVAPTRCRAVGSA